MSLDFVLIFDKFVVAYAGDFVLSNELYLVTDSLSYHDQVVLGDKGPIVGVSTVVISLYLFPV